MRKFIVTIDGKNYEVGVEEVKEGVPAPVSAPAPAAVPTAPAAAASPAASAASGEKLLSPFPGLIKKFLVKEGDTVIDVGCGSGILGIAAAKLGAKRAYLTDIDPVAVESAAHNAEKNGVEDRVVVAHSDLLADAEIRGDVALANITAEILVRLAPTVPRNLKEGGTLILSGIIADRLARVKEAFGAEGLTLQKQMHKGEWYALVFTA